MDVQFYLGQVKKPEAKVKKLEKDLEDQQESDSDFYSNREAEKKKLVDKVNELKELASKDTFITEKLRMIEKVEIEIEEKNRSIGHLRNANTKLLELLSK